MTGRVPAALALPEKVLLPATLRYLLQKLESDVHVFDAQLGVKHAILNFVRRKPSFILRRGIYAATYTVRSVGLEFESESKSMYYYSNT